MTAALRIAGARVLLDNSLTECDVMISNGLIDALVPPESEAAADEVLDAHGLIALPGIIDAHTHIGLSGYEQDWFTESRAAAQGGVTTVLNYVHAAGSYFDAAVAEKDRAEQQSVVDFGFHLVVMNELQRSEIRAYAEQLGARSFKFFTNFRGAEGAHMGLEGSDSGFFYELCRSVAEIPDVILNVHTENVEIIWRKTAQLKADGRDGLDAWAAARPDISEVTDLSMAIIFAQDTGCRMYIPHLSSAAGVAIYRRHVAAGSNVLVETCPHYLTHTCHSQAGTLAKVNPPIRESADSEALWEALADGSITAVGSDHNSRLRERKEGSIWTINAGFPGLTTMLPVLLSEGYHKRGIPLERIAAVLCSGPARTFGLYPRKGVIAPGSDADIVLVDLEREAEVDSSRIASHADYSIYDGWRLKGWPATTIVRGRPIMQDGELRQQAPWGKYLHR